MSELTTTVRVSPYLDVTSYFVFSQNASRIEISCLTKSRGIKASGARHCVQIHPFFTTYFESDSTASVQSQRKGPFPLGRKCHQVNKKEYRWF